MCVPYSFPRLSMVMTLSIAALSIGCTSEDSSSGTPTASINSDSGDSSQDPSDRSLSGPVRLTPNSETSPSPARQPVNLHPIVVITTTLGDIKIKLNSEKAPNTVANFLDNYVDLGAYENTIFHYVDKGFLISAGGYTADLKAVPTRGEILNEADNGLKNLRGTVAMARHPQYSKSATSQFFINLADNPALDHQEDKLDENYDENFGYCVFGEVIEGMDVIDKIAAAQVSDTDLFPKVPVEPVLIQKAQRLDLPIRRR